MMNAAAITAKASGDDFDTTLTSLYGAPLASSGVASVFVVIASPSPPPPNAPSPLAPQPRNVSDAGDLSGRTPEDDAVLGMPLYFLIILAVVASAVACAIVAAAVCVQRKCRTTKDVEVDTSQSQCREAAIQRGRGQARIGASSVNSNRPVTDRKLSNVICDVTPTPSPRSAIGPSPTSSHGSSPRSSTGLPHYLSSTDL